MSNKSLINIIYVSAISAIIGIIGVVSNINILEIFARIGSPVLLLSGTYLLISNGKFKESNEFKMMMGSIIIIMMGLF